MSTASSKPQASSSLVQAGHLAHSAHMVHPLHGAQYPQYNYNPMNRMPSSTTPMQMMQINAQNQMMRNIKVEKFKTVPCKYFHGPQGCEKKTDCTFIHDEAYAGRMTPSMEMRFRSTYNPGYSMPLHNNYSGYNATGSTGSGSGGMPNSSGMSNQSGHQGSYMGNIGAMSSGYGMNSVHHADGGYTKGISHVPLPPPPQS